MSTLDSAPSSREPERQQDAHRSDWRVTARALWSLAQEFQRNPVSMLAKQAAYSLLYAVPSVLIVLISLTAFVDKETNAGTSQALENFIESQAPEELQPLLQSLVENAIVETSQSTATVTALISLGIAIWGGAGGVGALIYACNRVYEIRDTRSWFVKTLLRLGLLIVGGALVVLAFLLYAFGQRLGEWIADLTSHETILVNILTSSRSWALTLLTGSLLLLYFLGPDVEHAIVWVLPGVVAGTLAIAIAFAALDLVLGVMDPGSAYGAAGSVLIFLWSLYVVSAIVVVGAVLNAMIARRFDRKLRSFLAAHPEKRLFAEIAKD
jgi:membrane protein